MNVIPVLALTTFLSAIASACVDPPPLVPTGDNARVAGQKAPATDWRKGESGILSDQVQLTFANRFLKAGESYFSPGDDRIIFQAIEKPAAGETAGEIYAMFVADVKREAGAPGGKIIGIDNLKQISPKGSANTCGWFHPTDPNIVIFASTIDPPIVENVPGFERLSGRYKWMFPRNMKIVRCRLDRADASSKSLEVLVGDNNAYAAECSLSPDGRHLLYCSLGGQRGDIFVKDLRTNAVHAIVQSDAYDGGPFFSPDGKRICYRSDRRTEHYLQLYVADLVYNDKGEIIGKSREYQLTDDDEVVQWCPFWTHDGRRLAYASSELGHTNYEVFMIDADPGDVEGSTRSIKYGTRRRQITHANRADVLPAFSSDGKTMIWTSQRGADGESQLWAATVVINLDATQAIEAADHAAKAKPAAPAKPKGDEFIQINDPETGRFYVYYPDSRRLAEYDRSTHKTTDVTDPTLRKHLLDLKDAQEEPQ